MNQIHEHSCFKKRIFRLFVFLTLCLFDSLPFTHSRDSCFKTAHQGTPLRERSVKVNVGSKVKVGGKYLGDWHLPPNVYFSCACPKFSLFERMNHCMSEGISEHDNCTGLCDGLFIRAVTSAVTCAVTSAATFARSLQHLARSAIRVAHDDRAALFAVD